jgi:alanine transaminase
LKVLEKTGIVLVPGSGFLQREGTYHFRTTNLVRPEERLAQSMNELRKFNDWFHSEYK